MAIKTYFTGHPESAGETYGEHFMVAMSMSRQLFGAALAAAVHALVPNFHETTASKRIHDLAHCLDTNDRAAITPLRKVRCRESLRQASQQSVPASPETTAPLLPAAPLHPASA